MNNEVNYGVVGFLAWLKGVLEGSNYYLDEDQLKEVAKRIDELNLVGMPRSLCTADPLAEEKRLASEIIKYGIDPLLDSSSPETNEFGVELHGFADTEKFFDPSLETETESYNG